MKSLRSKYKIIYFFGILILISGKVCGQVSTDPYDLFPGGIGDGHAVYESKYKTLNGAEPEVGLPVVSDFELCGGGVAIISATPGNNASTIYWYESLNSTDPLATTTDFEVDLISSEKFWVASVNEATGVQSNKVSMNVFVYYADAGIDQFLSDTLYSPRLNANNPTGEGVWTVKTGSGILEDATDPNTTVTGLGYGLNTFTWTLLGCSSGASSDDVNLYFLDYKYTGGIGDGHATYESKYKTLNGAEPEVGLPVVYDFELCGDGVTILNATPGDNANTVYWYESLNSTEPLATTVDFEVELTSTEIFWVASVDETTGVKSNKVSMTVYVQYADAGIDQFLSDTLYSPRLNANNPTGEGIWTVKTGSGIFEDATDTNTIVNGLGYGLNTFTWTLLGCSSGTSSDDVNLYFLDYKYQGGIGDGHGTSDVKQTYLGGLPCAPPEVITKDITVSLDENGFAQIYPEDVDNGSGSSCVIQSTVLSQYIFDCSDIGVNTVTLTITDEHGSYNQADATVVVIDDLAPVPDIATLPVLQGERFVNVSEFPTATDNCNGTVTASTTDPLLFENQGTFYIDWIFTDGNGNQRIQTQQVIVKDQTPPTAVCQNINVQLDELNEASIIIDDIEGNSYDNCGIALSEILFGQTFYTCLDVGLEFDVVVKVTDVNGLSGTCTSKVTVLDDINPCNQPPVAVCQNITVGTGADCAATINVEQVNNGSYDSDQDELSFSLDNYGPLTIGQHTVTLYVADPSGESDQCMTTVTVEDNTPPIAACKGLTINLDPNGTALITPEQINNGATDNCGIVKLVSVIPNNFTCADVGENTVTLTINDGNNNANTCEATVIVTDTQAPAIITNDQVVNTDTDQCGAWVTVSATASDNCLVGDPEGVRDDGQPLTAIYPVGTTNITWNVTDENGNDAVEVIQKVIVTDVQAPTAICKDLTITLGTNLMASIDESDIDNGSSDACGLQSLVIDKTEFTCVDIATNRNLVTLTVTDNNHNVSTCKASVTVNKHPTILTYTGDLSGQYSDQVKLSAKLTDNDGGVLSGRIIKFSIGTKSVSAVTQSDGVATSTMMILDQFPIPDYKVIADYTGENCYTESKDDSKTFEITPEDGCWSYTGPVISTVNRDGEVTLLLTATVYESDLNSHGDISTADVLLVIKDENEVPIKTVNCPVVLDPNDNSVGYISYEQKFTGIGDDAADFSILLEINGNYDDEFCAEIGSLHLYKPDGEFITGGGFIYVSDPYGAYAPNAGTKTNFGYHIKWNKTMKNLQGKMNIIFRRMENDGILHTYKIKTNATSSLGIANPVGNCTFAEFTGKCNLTNITDPQNPYSVGGGLELRVITNDCGEPGTEDAIGITLWDKNTLLFSSNWDGKETLGQNLGWGNLIVHTNAKKSAEVVTNVQPEFKLAELRVYPNPFDDRLKFEFISPETVDARIDLYDASGRLVKTIFKDIAEGGVHYQAEFNPETVISATYFYRVSLDKYHYTGKVIYKNNKAYE